MRWGVGRSFPVAGRDFRLGVGRHGPYGIARLGGLWLLLGHGGRPPKRRPVRIVRVPEDGGRRVIHADGWAVLAAVLVWAFVAWELWHSGWLLVVQLYSTQPWG